MINRNNDFILLNVKIILYFEAFARMFARIFVQLTINITEQNLQLTTTVK